jgi:hypothetical protein
MLHRSVLALPRCRLPDFASGFEVLGRTARRFVDSIINRSGGQVGDKPFTGPSYWPFLLNIQRIVQKLCIPSALRAGTV